MAAASRTSTLFAVFKNLNAFSPFSLLLSLSLFLTLYKYSQFRLCVLSRRFIAFYRSVKSNRSLTFCFGNCFLHSKNIIIDFIITHCCRLIFQLFICTRYICDVILRLEAKVSNVRVNLFYLNAKCQMIFM